jgi:hypothetical protein
MRKDGEDDEKLRNSNIWVWRMWQVGQLLSTSDIACFCCWSCSWAIRTLVPARFSEKNLQWRYWTFCTKNICGGCPREAVWCMMGPKFSVKLREVPVVRIYIWNAKERLVRQPMTPESATWDPSFRRNFGRLVLGCIDSYDSNQILILQRFSRSTKLSSWFFENVAKFCKKSQKFAKFLRNFRILQKKMLILRILETFAKWKVFENLAR